MPNASATAAAPGLPKSDTVEMAENFHLLIGRELAGIASERDLMEQQANSAPAECPIEANYLRHAIEHLDDRESALLAVLAAVPSTTLAGAAVQVFAALQVFDRITLFKDPDPADERAVRRLLWSAADVIADAAGLDRKEDGPNAIAGSTNDPWRDVFARMGQAKSHVRAAVLA